MTATLTLLEIERDYGDACIVSDAFLVCCFELSLWDWACREVVPGRFVGAVLDAGSSLQTGLFFLSRWHHDRFCL